MCGILGCLTNKKNFLQKTLNKKVLNLLSNRGPDQTNHINRDNFFFGHTRLSIIGLNEQTAQQPVFQDNKILVFNGEIYNYKEISKLLNSKGVRDSGKSDTETLFKSLNYFGFEKTLSILDGMFAFAYYDLKKKNLFLARDRIGEKPLYFSKEKNFFIFSSEIKAIFKSNLKNFKPNSEMFHEIFLHGKIYGKHTAFKDILELEPGTFLNLNVKKNEYQIKKYWILEDIKKIDSNISKNLFEQKFNECITSRLTSDIPVGSLISGGIDSSSLVYKILELNDSKTVNLFFAENENKNINEMKNVKYFYRFIKKKFKNKNINLYTLKKQIKDYWRDIEKVAYFNDEPCTYSNFHLVYSLSKLIKDSGIKVIFSGEGSDEIFHGYERFVRANQYFDSHDINKNLQHIYYGNSIKNLEDIKKITNDKFIEEKIQSSESWIYLKKLSKNLKLNEVQTIFSQKFRMQSLLQRQDRACMAFGVESRAPFLKPSFVKWANSLPLKLKYNKKQQKTKLILKDYMSNFLNKKIIDRKKNGFENDFDLEFKNKYTLDKIKLLVNNDNSFSANFLNKKNILKILNNEHKKNHNLSMIKLILSTEIWFKVFFNNNSKRI